MAFSITSKTWENVEFYLKRWRLSSWQQQQLWPGSAALLGRNCSCSTHEISRYNCINVIPSNPVSRLFILSLIHLLSSELLQTLRFRAVCVDMPHGLCSSIFPSHHSASLYTCISAHPVVSLRSEITESPHHRNFNHQLLSNSEENHLDMKPLCKTCVLITGSLLRNSPAIAQQLFVVYQCYCWIFLKLSLKQADFFVRCLSGSS